MNNISLYSKIEHGFCVVIHISCDIFYTGRHVCSLVGNSDVRFSSADTVLFWTYQTNNLKLYREKNQLDSFQLEETKAFIAF